jgi:TDG/mug DNA glycosylase family protein
LFESGLLPEQLSFADDVRLPEWGYALTNVVARATSGSSELTRTEYARGARVLLRKIVDWRPEIVAPVGVSVWRALAAAAAVEGVPRGPLLLGLQPSTIAGARVYVLPNPSGRNAHVSYAGMLEVYTGLRKLSARVPGVPGVP